MLIELARQQKVSKIFNTIIGAAHWINCVVKVVIEFVSLKIIQPNSQLGQILQTYFIENFKIISFRLSHKFNERTLENFKIISFRWSYKFNERTLENFKIISFRWSHKFNEKTLENFKIISFRWSYKFNERTLENFKIISFRWSHKLNERTLERFVVICFFLISRQAHSSQQYRMERKSREPL